ncbi:peptidylprolyl isomerase [Hydrogenoanaerobacterium sp.]|uniref:peptidylprolyl isomerase n=1 Tax=Hydrogenoanaerobacterium sp. TaxID=2953763 RepID=UPI002897F3E9|nr:peptidylprolyl isomerase [Hydrogenoanaerobacterium sp.]
MSFLKKSVALLLAVTMSAAALAGCSSAPKKESYLTDSEGNPVQVENIVTINGEGISLEEYRYYFLSSKAYLEQMFGGMAPTDSGKNDIWADEEMINSVKEQALEAIKFDRVLRKYAKDNKIELTVEDKKTVDDNINGAIEQTGGLDKYKQALEEMFLTEELYRSVVESQVLQSKVQKAMTASDSRLAPTDDEVKAYFNENYLRAKHILIETQGITDEAEIAKKKETADKALERAKAGEDFDALIKEYGEDPGMANSPEGYYFPEGQMVTEFYEGTKALKDNEISGLVESSFGWHIIQRLPIADDYFDKNKDTIAPEIVANLAGTKLNEEVKALMDACVVEKTPEYESINAKNLK